MFFTELASYAGVNSLTITNEIRHIEWHETCKCKCRLNGSACNDKKRWNDDKCRCEGKELIDKGVSDKWFIWNPSNLDYENCKCRKKLVDKLTKECTENVEEVKLAKITSVELHSAKNKNKHKCNSCTLCIMLFSIIFAVNIGIGSYFLCFYWYLKKMLFALSLILKQQFNECNSIELIKNICQTC